MDKEELHNLTRSVFVSSFTLWIVFKSTIVYGLHLCHNTGYARPGSEGSDQFLDAFIIIGLPNSPVFEANLYTMLAVCSYPGFAVNPSIVAGQSTVLEFWGLLLDNCCK